jgi:LemA protein
MPETALALGALILLLPGLWLIWPLFASRNHLHRDWERLQIALQRRRALTTLLIDTASRHDLTEPRLIEAIAELGTAQASHGDPDLRLPLENDLGRDLRILLTRAAEHPGLKDSRQYADLARDLAEVDAMIRQAGGRYNDSVKAYNLRLGRFPNSLMAPVLGLRPRRLFEIETAVAN